MVLIVVAWLFLFPFSTEFYLDTAKLRRFHYTAQQYSFLSTNCITGNVTMRSNVASWEMLLSDRQKSLSEEPHDDPEKQAWVEISCAAQIPESDQGWKAKKYWMNSPVRLATIASMLSGCWKTKGKFKSVLKGKPKPIKPSIVVIWCRHWSKFGKSMDRSVPNGYNHFYQKLLKCWSVVKKSSFPKTPKNCCWKSVLPVSIVACVLYALSHRMVWVRSSQVPSQTVHCGPHFYRMECRKARFHGNWLGRTLRRECFRAILEYFDLHRRLHRLDRHYRADASL